MKSAEDPNQSTASITPQAKKFNSGPVLEKVVDEKSSTPREKTPVSGRPQKEQTSQECKLM